jgi:hypothetical protein
MRGGSRCCGLQLPKRLHGDSACATSGEGEAHFMSQSIPFAIKKADNVQCGLTSSTEVFLYQLIMKFQC